VTFPIIIQTTTDMLGDPLYRILPRQPNHIGERIFRQVLRQKEMKLSGMRKLMFKFQSGDTYLRFLQAYPSIDDVVFVSEYGGCIGVMLSRWAREDRRQATPSPAGILGFATIGKKLNEYLYSWVVIEIMDVRTSHLASSHLIFAGGKEERFGDKIRAAIESRFKSGHVNFETAYGTAVDIVGAAVS
jgi:hypothetical protein